MTPSCASQYQSEAARDTCYAYLDSLAARKWPVSSEERFISTSYGDTFVRISGDASAPALVMLPGAAASSLMWVPNIAALSTKCRCYAVDQIGDFGKSLVRKPLSEIADVLVWLDELLDGLDLRSGVSMMGVSAGGAITAEYALHAPERLRRAILIAPAATVLRINVLFMWRLILAKWKGLPSLFRWIFADGVKKDPQGVEDIIAELQLYMKSVRRAVPMPRVWSDAEWRGLQVPTLLVVGEHEVIYSADKAVRHLQRVAPQVRTQMIPGAGHDLTFVQPKMVSDAILSFVR